MLKNDERQESHETGDEDAVHDDCLHSGRPVKGKRLVHEGVFGEARNVDKVDVARDDYWESEMYQAVITASHQPMASRVDPKA